MTRAPTVCRSLLDFSSLAVSFNAGELKLDFVTSDSEERRTPSAKDEDHYASCNATSTGARVLPNQSRLNKSSRSSFKAGNLIFSLSLSLDSILLEIHSYAL
jgi:hypothetical protein